MTVEKQVHEVDDIIQAKAILMTLPIGSCGAFSHDSRVPPIIMHLIAEGLLTVEDTNDEN